MCSNLIHAFDALRKKHGSHVHAALALGLDPDHYRKLRNGRANMTERTAEFIRLKAKEAEDIIPPQSSPVAEAHP